MFAKASFSVGSYGPMGYGLGILVNPVCSFGTSNLGAATQKEIPIYGSGKIGTYYPAHSQLADQAGQEAGSTAYELTDHLGNVRALLRTHANEYTATMEDDGTATYTNPRVRENVYFKNLWTTERRDAQMNHTTTVTMPQGYAPANSAYLYWVNGQAGNGPQQKSVGPAIALAVNAGDRISASAWARFKIKASYSRAPIQNIIASVLSGQYAYSNGLESITQATNAFNAGLVGLAPQNGDNPNAPSAYLNYILFDSLYARKAAGAVQVPQAAGFEEPQRGSGYTNNNLLKFGNDIQVSQTGYLYIWVSNESENTEVWFDDLNVIHQKTLVAEATDYGVWGDVMREQKWEDLDAKYRYGYQGKYAEKDDETGWGHFKLREYDDVIGRWTSIDPKRQFSSGYVGMGNNPVSKVDPDGAYSIFGALWRSIAYNGQFTSTKVNGKRTYGYIDGMGNKNFGISNPNAGTHTYGDLSSYNQSLPTQELNIQPYVSLSWGKESAEGPPKIIPASLNGSVTLTTQGAYVVPLGGDITFGSGGTGISGMSWSLSAGLVVGPVDGLSGHGYYATAGFRNVGLQVSRSVNSLRPFVQGDTYTIGPVISTSGAWLGVGYGYSFPITPNTVKNVFK